MRAGGRAWGLVVGGICTIAGVQAGLLPVVAARCPNPKWVLGNFKLGAGCAAVPCLGCQLKSSGANRALTV